MDLTRLICSEAEHGHCHHSSRQCHEDELSLCNGNLGEEKDGTSENTRGISETEDVQLYIVHIFSRTVIGKLIVHLPLFGMVFAFVCSVVFHFDQVNMTACGRKHTIPSLSAATGVAPQRYVWQICIGLHSAPRYVFCFAYYQYYNTRLASIASRNRTLFKRLVSLTFWLECIEIFSLTFVNCIANVENYGVHEKFFVVYLIASVFRMFFAMFLYKWTHPPTRHPRLEFSYSIKKTAYLSNWSFVVCVIYFHLRHRLLCEKYAFDLFSVCEYGIALANMYFNQTAMYDFHEADFHFGQPAEIYVDKKSQ